MEDNRGGGNFWCDGHHCVETLENPDEDRLPGCLLQGPFDTWQDARSYGLRLDPQQVETAKQEQARDAWNWLLEGIPGL